MSALCLWKATPDEIAELVEKADDPLVASVLCSLHWAKTERDTEEEVKAVAELTELLVYVRGG